MLNLWNYNFFMVLALSNKTRFDSNLMKSDRLNIDIISITPAIYILIRLFCDIVIRASCYPLSKVPEYIILLADLRNCDKAPIVFELQMQI